MTLYVDRLRCQLPDGVLAIRRDPVRLSWRLGPAGSALQQLSYEIEAASDPDHTAVIAATGIVAGDDQIGVPAPGGALGSREVRFYRARVRDESGWSPWSPSLRVEAGLLSPADWQARAITLPDDPGRHAASPSPVLRREFDVRGTVARARLYVSSLGLHRTTINGRSVSDDLLAPGWTTYRHRLLVDAYDVTHLIAPGANAIGAVLGDGWFRGRIGWEPEGVRCQYGSDLGLIAQLEIDLADGSHLVVATDRAWRASTAEIRSADLYDGCEIDLRALQPGFDRPGFSDGAWVAAHEVPFDPAVLDHRSAPPVRRIATLPVTVEDRGGGRWMLDVGQNIAGWIRLRVAGGGGAGITVRHAEVLEADGSLHMRALRTARAADTYVLADDGPVDLEPAFTFHGFRYAEITGPVTLLGAEAVAISCDTSVRGAFECSEPALNRLHENAVWSQRDNFVSVPTDCPQRDERLGWTGDAQAFAATASTLFDSAAFWESWLRDLALDQDPRLGVSTLVPDVVINGEPRYGRAGWADAATIVPWSVYEAYGDRAVLAAQLDSMRDWIGSLEQRLGPDGLLPESMQYGDWLDPDAPDGRPWESKADPTYLANGFLVHSARLTARAAKVLGDADLERRCHALADRVASAAWERWSEEAVANQTSAAIAIRLGVAPEGRRAEVAAALARLVREAGGAIRTGFLGTPLVLPALAAFGYFDECYLALLRREHPSWLYQVDQGATTIWERWDAIRPDGSIHPGTMTAPPGMTGAKEGHMLSFNHYAYGAVIDWVYRHVAGLAPDAARPGYRHVRIAPRPAAGIDRASASIDAVFGEVAVQWRLRDGRLIVRIGLPTGTTGTFTAPTTERSTVEVDGRSSASPVELSAGTHLVIVTEPRIADPANALAQGATTAES